MGSAAALRGLGDGVTVYAHRVPATTVGFGHGEPLTRPDGAAAWRELGERCAAGPDAVPDPLG